VPTVKKIYDYISCIFTIKQIKRPKKGTKQQIKQFCDTIKKLKIDYITYIENYI